MPHRAADARELPDPEAPDPALGDLGLDAAPVGPDPLSSLASMLPAAAGSFPPAGQGGSPLDALGLAGPLAGLVSQLADQPLARQASRA